jgi:hypothetical protein
MIGVGNEDAAPEPASVGRLWNAFPEIRQSGARNDDARRITRYGRANAILVIIYRTVIVASILAALECAI